MGLQAAALGLGATPVETIRPPCSAPGAADDTAAGGVLSICIRPTLTPHLLPCRGY